MLPSPTKYYPTIAVIHGENYSKVPLFPPGFIYIILFDRVFFVYSFYKMDGNACQLSALWIGLYGHGCGCGLFAAF